MMRGGEEVPPTHHPLFNIHYHAKSRSFRRPSHLAKGQRPLRFRPTTLFLNFPFKAAKNAKITQKIIQRPFVTFALWRKNLR